MNDPSETDRQLLEAYLENAPDGIYITDMQGNFLYGNRKSEEIIGYTRDELISKNILRSNILTEGSLEKAAALFKASIEGRPTGPDELELVDREGRPVHVEIKTNPIDYEGQRVILGFVRDISGHKRTEDTLRRTIQALHASEERYRLLFEEAIEGIFRTTIDGRAVMANAALARTLGYDSPEEAIATLTDIASQVYADPKDRASMIERLKRDGKVMGSEVLFKRPDGTTLHVILNFRLVRDEGGAPAFIEGSCIDITDRYIAEEALKASEEELRRSNAMYRTIFDNSGTSMSIIGEDTKVVFCNEELAKITGYSREEIEGRMSWTEFVHKEDLAAMRRYHGDREEMSGETPRQYEFRFVDRHGNVRNMINTVAIIPGTKMRVAAQLDVTDLKQAEAEKERLQSQLLQSQKMEAVGTLAGGVAHDFNNILTALIGYASLLKMKLGDGNPLIDYANQILTSSEKAAQLTRSLLTFSRKQPVTLKPLKLNDIISGTEKLLERVLTENITLKTLLTDEDTTIKGDATQIDQILFNLATNARDAMPRGGNLTIETRRVTLDERFRRVHGYGETGDYVLVSVSDTGLGLDEKTKEHIFDPFFTTKEVGKGTGLGLSTVYGIVKQHNGYIDAYSELNKGTAFHIHFPALAATDREEQRFIPEVKGGNETILVAEDNEEVRDLIKTILTEYGYTVIESVDGEEAVAKFRDSKKINLLIIDSVMPKISGREVYDRVRAIDPEVKVLFMSGYTRDIVLDKGIEEKDFHFVAKPLSPNELLGKVREVIDGGV